MSQTRDEILRVFGVWETKYMPANLANTQANGNAIAQHCAEVYGFVSIANLNASVRYLIEANKLEIVQPKVKSRQELAQEQAAETYRKDLAARNEAREENTKPVSREEKERLANEAALIRQLQEIFETFRVYRGPGIVDSPRTDELLSYLRSVNIQKGGKTDLALTLAAVKNARFCETVADMKRVVGKFLENYNNENNLEYHRQRQRERESRQTVGPMVRNYAE